jgi:hypothetical protein
LAQKVVGSDDEGIADDPDVDEENTDNGVAVADGAVDVEAEKREGIAEVLKGEREKDGDAKADGQVDSSGTETGQKQGMETARETDLKRLVELLNDTNATAKEGVFLVIGGLLFFSDRSAGNLRLCFPDSLVDDILQQCHDRTGHPGICRLGLSMSSRYYFPRMSRRIRAYTNNCAICQTSKPSNEK